MKVLALLLLSLSIPNPKVALPSRPPIDHVVNPVARANGQWYMAESGHAVFCYGPVKLVKGPQGELQRVATFCRGNRTMVPLKD